MVVGPGNNASQYLVIAGVNRRALRAVRVQALRSGKPRSDSHSSHSPRSSDRSAHLAAKPEATVFLGEQGGAQS